MERISAGSLGVLGGIHADMGVLLPLLNCQTVVWVDMLLYAIPLLFVHLSWEERSEDNICTWEIQVCCTYWASQCQSMTCHVLFHHQLGSHQKALPSTRIISIHLPQVDFLLDVDSFFFKI